MRRSAVLVDRPLLPGLPALLRRPTPAQAFLGAGTVAVALYYLLPAGGTSQAVLYSAIGFAAGGAVAVGARVHLPQLQHRLPWYLFGGGLVSFALGDALFSYYSLTGATPFPSAADGFYLAGYPLHFAALILLVRRLGRLDTRFAVADALIVTGAFALVQWVFVIEPLTHESGSVTARAFLLAYPAMDLLLVAGLARFFLSPVWRTNAFRWLIAAIVLQLVADEVYAFTSSTYADGSWLDALWLASYVTWGVAALDPSVSWLARRQRMPEPRLTPARLVLLAAALLAAPAVLVAEQARGRPLDAYLVAAFAALIGLLVLARIVGLLTALGELRREEGRLRAQTEAANERLRELDRLKDDFVALVSHDLRTPLTSVGGYVELLLDPRSAPLDETQRRFLEVVQRNTGRLERLVDDLLLVARIRAGRLELEPEEVDLSELVRHAVAGHRPQAEAKRLELAAETNGAGPILADPHKLERILDNLVANAIKFTPEGGRVVVRAGGDLTRAILEVADTGRGIAPDDRERLFERFYRAGETTAEQGTGLGLWITKAIVEAHGGSIGCESAPGIGSTFRVELPREAQEVR